MREQGRGKSQRETSEAATERTEESTTVAEQEEETDTVASGTELTEEMFIEENESPVETFEEVDYVEGRWNSTGHYQIIDGTSSWRESNKIVLLEEDINIFKMGAVFPDSVFPVRYDDDNKIWHGGYAENYVANYIFATQVAQLAGKTSDSVVEKGQKQEWYQLMKKQINTKRIWYRSSDQKEKELAWDEILKAYNYKNASKEKKENMRRLFLYGMASHILTDTYAHSAYCRCNGSMIKISDYHTDKNLNEDNIDVHRDRFTDAKHAMQGVFNLYYFRLTATPFCFAPTRWGEKRGYCLRKLLENAQKASVNSADTKLIDAYASINY